MSARPEVDPGVRRTASAPAHGGAVTRAPLLAVVLLVVAMALIVVALVRDGNNAVLALVGVGAAVAATFVASTSRGRSG
jgi:hypothetical protein